MPKCMLTYTLHKYTPQLKTYVFEFMHKQSRLPLISTYEITDKATFYNVRGELMSIIKLSLSDSQEQGLCFSGRL